MYSIEQGTSEKLEIKEVDGQRNLERRAADIRRKYREYCKITCEELGVASIQQTEELKDWALDFELTEKEIQDREYWYENDYAKRIGSAKELYSGFASVLQTAVSENLISSASRDRWFQRLRDRNVGYKEKENWIHSEFPKYIQEWHSIAKDRQELLQHQDKKTFIQHHPVFGILLNQEKFLSLHFTKQRDLVSSASAAFNAQNGAMGLLYKVAEAKLRGAVLRGTLAQGKTGIWLKRIFKDNASQKVIEAFVHGKASDSLEGLMQNWATVRERFTVVMRKASERGDNSAARGFTLVTINQFLAMHYEKRLSYVQQAEDRLEDAKNVKEEQPIFLKIRHAMDVKDWIEASVLIEEAKTMHLKGSNWPRLKAMEQHVKQFCSQKIESHDASTLNEAPEKIDAIVRQIPSELQEMIVRLLRGPHGNRNIHQFRWIVYNNKWCRDHGYLDQERARKGASKENKELTKQRARDGDDIGRHDVLDDDTAGQQFIRKQEFADHTATLMHVNVKGKAPSTLAEWLEHEQNPRVLYWTTFCALEDKDPKPDNWHNDLFFNLTELRSLMRTVNNAGCMYDGLGKKLISMN